MDERLSMNTNQQSNSPRYHGIIPPLVTPLLDRDRLDRDGTKKLLEHVIGGGVHGIFILGTTGEAPSLSYRLRREFIQLVCSEVRQAIPVLVGVTDTSMVESLDLSKVARDAGADAAVLTTPYYFPAGQTELIQYVESFLADSPLPLMLYNMPSMTKVWFEIDTITKLASCTEIIGMKDSSGDLDYFQKLLKLKEIRPDWSIMIGPEHLTSRAISLGGDGGVNGGANIFPELFVAMYQAAVDSDQDRLEVLNQRIEKLQQIYCVGKYASRFIKATKSALSILDLCSDQLAPPFNRFLEPERRAVESIIRRIESP